MVSSPDWFKQKLPKGNGRRESWERKLGADLGDLMCQAKDFINMELMKVLVSREQTRKQMG